MAGMLRKMARGLAARFRQGFNSANPIAPGNPTYDILWDWINSPMKGSQSLDWELRSKLRSMRREARALVLNNPVVSQYLALLKVNVVGPNGIRLQAQVRNNNGELNKAINDKIEAAHREWWTSPWVDRRMSGIQGEQLLLQTVAVDGEAFVRRCLGTRFRFGIALQMIDPDLVDHTLNQPRGGGFDGVVNEIRLGIEVDEWGAAAGIWIWDRTQGDLNLGAPQKRIRIPAAEIIHLYDPQRINQTRGITWFNSVMVPLKQLDGFMEAEVIAARTAACAFPIFETTAPEFESENAPKNYSVELNPGRGFQLPAGLKLANWNPNHPNIAVGEFNKAVLRFFSSGLHVSYNALANDLEGVNYSSMRSGLLIERDNWRSLQRMWIDRFKTPVHGWFVPAAMLSGELVLDSRDPQKFLTAKWVPRGWPWVDPLKDINAAVIAVENGLGSRTGYLAEGGEDFEEICEELADELSIAGEFGLDFTGGAVSPKDVLKQAEAEEQQPVVTAKKSSNRALCLTVLNRLLDDDIVNR